MRTRRSEPDWLATACACLENVDVVISTPFWAPLPIRAPMNACTVSLPIVLPGW
jgi:hypothetical protein